jgi:hypothetical protein
MDLSSWMRRKRLRWWVALLLPALVLRSLIPLGFMPMFGPGYGVQFVLCEGYAPVPGTTSSMSMSMSMDMPMDAATDPQGQNHASPVDGGAPVHQDHGTCPYGSAPALGGLPTLAVVLVAIQPPAVPAVIAAQVGYFEISPRAQSSRGPPA